MDDAPRLLAGFLLITLSLAVYFTPTLVAFGRDHYNRGAIFVLNLLLGWTLFGVGRGARLGVHEPRNCDGR